MRVTLLGGGTGCARLAVPLAAAIGAPRLTVIVNTGDDLWRHGLRICPDLDTNLYALAGMRDRERGWGVAGDTFRTMDQLRRLGEDAWFALGDLDLATHLLRSAGLRAGASLSAVTADLARRAGVTARLLPATDDEVATRVLTSQGELSFQEYFVRERAEVDVLGVHIAGIERARPAPGVVESIMSADLVVIGPSNPVASLGPILGLPGVRTALETRRNDRLPSAIVTPVVDAVPISAEGEARRARCRASMMRAHGADHRASGVGAMLSGLAETFVVDRADVSEIAALERLGYRVVVADTLIGDHGDGQELVGSLLTAAR